MKSAYAVLITMMAWLPLAAISQFACADEASAVVDHKASARQMVIAVHQFVLNDGVDAKAFEALVLEEVLPLYNAVEGQTVYLMKGDRGLRKGKYSMVFIFPDVEARNRIYLPEGGFSEDFNQVFQGTDGLFGKMDAFIVGDPWVNHTDYVNIPLKPSVD